MTPTTEPTLAANLRTIATCNTDKPALAVAALIEAAAAILTARFNRYEVVHMLTSGFKAALAVAQPAHEESLEAAQERLPGRVTAGELVRYFSRHAVELRGEAENEPIATAMVTAAIALLEIDAGERGAIEHMRRLVDLHDDRHSFAGRA